MINTANKVMMHISHADVTKLLRVARALQDVKNYFANSTISSGDVFQHPYFKDGIRHAYTVLKEVEHLLDE